MKDLKYKLAPPHDYTLKDEQLFMYQHGAFNCKILKFKSVLEIIEVMEKYDSDSLMEGEKEFIVKNANKEVLCYICHRWEDNPDIFVYGDDNIAFRKECFV